MFDLFPDAPSPYVYIQVAREKCDAKIRAALRDYVREIHDKSRKQSRGQDSRPLAIETLLLLSEGGAEGYTATRTVKEQAGFAPKSSVLRWGLEAWVSAGVVERMSVPGGSQVGYRIRDEFYVAVKEALGQ